ncbi:MAG: IS1182 family transposase [Candidatus Omnitrophica bacterium]|nr:IS1182 family transposase [Candidatus Omnitrophota bacterium]
MQLNDYNNKEMLLFPASIGDYLSKDHLAWIIDEVVDELSLSYLYDKVSSVGNPSYHPKMMLKILFYGYTQRTFSARKIAKKLETDIAFIFLSGMQKPDFRTIADFRKNNLNEISRLFVRIVRLCKKLNMVELGHISLDSTVIKANASKEQFYTKDRLDQEEQAIKQKIDEFLKKAQDIDDYEDRKFGPDKRGDEIPRELRDRKKRLEKLRAAKKALEEESLKKINITDCDATFQKSHGHLVSGYRTQISVDKKEQIIVACDVTNSASDTAHLTPLIEQSFQNTQKPTDDSTIITADSGYSSMQNLKDLEESKQNIDAYIPDTKYQAKQRNKQIDEDSPFHKKNFKYNRKQDTYLCPNNRKLKFKGIRTDDTGNRFSYYRCNSCKGCKYFGVCTKSPQGRAIKIYENEYLIHNMRKKLNNPEGKLIYKRRKTIVEPVLGNIKHNLGFREFLLRGLNKIKAEFSLIAIAHNILKIAKFIKKQKLPTLKDNYLIPSPLG